MKWLKRVAYELYGPDEAPDVVTLMTMEEFMLAAAEEEADLGYEVSPDDYPDVMVVEEPAEREEIEYRPVPEMIPAPAYASMKKEGYELEEYEEMLRKVKERGRKPGVRKFNYDGCVSKIESTPEIIEGLLRGGTLVIHLNEAGEFFGDSFKDSMLGAMGTIPRHLKDYGYGALVGKIGGEKVVSIWVVDVRRIQDRVKGKAPVEEKPVEETPVEETLEEGIEEKSSLIFDRGWDINEFVQFAALCPDCAIKVLAELGKSARIVQEKGKWCVKAESGRNMGCYDSKEKAQKRLQQVEMFKAMEKKKKVK